MKTAERKPPTARSSTEAHLALTTLPTTAPHRQRLNPVAGAALGKACSARPALPMVSVHLALVSPSARQCGEVIRAGGGGGCVASGEKAGWRAGAGARRCRNGDVNGDGFVYV